MSIEKDFSKSLERQKNQERERATQLLSLLEVGVSETSDVIGYHGTSTEALEILLKTGTLPGQTRGNEYHDLGDLFVMPVSKNIPSPWFHENHSKDQPSEPEESEGYAGDIALRHFVLHQLNIPLSDKISHDIVMELEEERERPISISAAAKKFVKRVGEEKIEALFEKGLERKGVLLSIKKTALDKHGLGFGDSAGYDAKLQTGASGLTLEDIGGIRTLGKDGEDFIKRLQKIART